MAKRFNVSIPDALAERMEPFKDNLSLSALMQEAIERELARLTMSDEDKELRQQFKTAAISAWLERFPGMGEAMTAYAERLFHLAGKDGQTEIFRLYRALFFLVKMEDGVKEVFRHTHPKATNIIELLEKGNASFLKNFLDSFSEFFYDECVDDIIDFIDSYVEFDISDTKYLYFLANNDNVHSLLFNALDERIRGIMTESDLYKYVLDIDTSNPVAIREGQY
jgi:hypothetical protein